MNSIYVTKEIVKDVITNPAMYAVIIGMIGIRMGYEGREMLSVFLYCTAGVVAMVGSPSAVVQGHWPWGGFTVKRTRKTTVVKKTVVVHDGEVPND